jgi:hypothetical protein
MSNQLYNTTLIKYQEELVELGENFKFYLDEYIKLYPTAKVYKNNQEIQTQFNNFDNKLKKNQTDLELLLSNITTYFAGLNSDSAKIQTQINKIKKANDKLEIMLQNLQNSNNAAQGLYEQYDFNLHNTITYNVLLGISSLIIFYVTYKKMIDRPNLLKAV